MSPDAGVAIVADIQLEYRVPPDDLVAYITLFYWFAADLPLFEDTERADHAQLRFRLSDGAADYRFADGSMQPAPRHHILAATSGAIRTRAIGPVRVFGMGVTPAGWAAMLGIDASAVHNRVIDAEALFGAALAAVGESIDHAGDIDAKVVIAASLVRALIRRHDDDTLGFVRQVDTWLAGATLEIDLLVAATGLSRRQLERRCNALYGAPPKLLARKYRALRAAVAMASTDADAETLALDGFYDQSHLIREIKHFTGATPGLLRAHPAPLARATMTQRRALGGQVGPLISDT